VAAATAQHVMTEVPHNPHQPCPPRGLNPESVQRDERTDQGLLRDVLRLLPAVQARQRVGERQIAVTLDQRIEGPLVAGARRGGQGFVGHVNHGLGDGHVEPGSTFQ
jgi:hypothetical protein